MLKDKKNPLCIGCSGGGGHNTAMDAIVQNLLSQGVQLQTYFATLYETKYQSGIQNLKIDFGSTISSIPGVGSGTKKILSYTDLPSLPTPHQIQEQINLVNEKQKQKDGTAKKLYYIDMQLTVMPSGFKNVAIWNHFQKIDDTEQLKKLVALQAESDIDNYKVVYDYFLEKLQSAAENNKPFTEIISTQAMVLSALCDAVLTYNEFAEGNKHIHIKQYMTDLATLGAVHFLEVLKELTQKQRSVLHLAGVGLTPDFLKNYGFSGNPPFFGLGNIENIEPDKNPMVRPGFSDPALQNIAFDQTCNLLYLKGEGNKTLIKPKKGSLPGQSFKVETEEIKPGEKVGAIMLGSQGGTDIPLYLKELSSKCSKIFVFNGKEKESEIQKIMKDMNVNCTIFCLESQSDLQIAPIMRRANIIVTRSGGISSMEQMTIHHVISPEMAKDKIILIHHKETDQIQLSSGISWEDENADKLISFLKKRGIKANKTTVKRIGGQLIPIDDQVKNLVKELTNVLQSFSSFARPTVEMGEISTFRDISQNIKMPTQLKLPVLKSFLSNLRRSVSSIFLPNFEEKIGEALQKLIKILQNPGSEVTLGKKEIEMLLKSPKTHPILHKYLKLNMDLLPE